MKRSRLGLMSVFINERTGGRPDESLCSRWVRTRGSDCWPCWLVGVVLGRDHCLNDFIAELKERRK